jgi:hypothetical protein
MRMKLGDEWIYVYFWNQPAKRSLDNVLAAYLYIVSAILELNEAKG